MAHVDWEQQSRKVTEIKQNTVSVRSRGVYQNSYTRFIAWIVLNKPCLVPDAFAERLGPGAFAEAAGCQVGSVSALSIKQLRKLLKPLLDRDASVPPLRFDDHAQFFGAEHAPGRLFNLYRDYGRELPLAMEKDLKKYFKGLKRELASAAVRGKIRTKTGKYPLPFELYSFLCEHLLQNTSKDMGFARTYMIIAWNLMCRSANAFGICHAHVKWKGDALCIYFAHQKNDQEGSRPRDPRHIYANPLNPAVCPVLALAMFWATSSFDGSDRLFPGSNQYERFRKCLHRLLDNAAVAEELNRRGVKADELGTHSMRKGAATYCASGSTACPSSTAVHLRAGRSLGGAQNTYLRYESAGDMHVGRTVSGLPPDSHQFSALPPHFEERDAEVRQAVECVFPRLPEGLTYVGEFTLASLVYHTPYLRSSLGSRHPVISSPLFQHPTMISDLSVKLPDDSSTRVRATGIPPHVAILGRMKTLLEEAMNAAKHIEDARAATVKTIMAELEKRAIGAGTVTFDGLHDALKQCLQAAGVTELLNKLNAGPHQALAQEGNREDGMPHATAHFWDGRFRRVPPDFDLPDCSVAMLWVWWQCGDTSKRSRH